MVGRIETKRKMKMEEEEWKSVEGFEGVPVSTLCCGNCCTKRFAIDLIRCLLFQEWLSSRPLLDLYLMIISQMKQN